MRVSGFTFVRNGTMLGYPFVESICSALPICDEFVVAVGAGEDDTPDRIQAIGDPKIRILKTRWNEGITAKGYVYAQQKMIAQFNCTAKELHQHERLSRRYKDGRKDLSWLSLSRYVQQLIPAKPPLFR